MPETRGPRLTLLAVAALGAAHALGFLGFVLDDAYISFRYARNLARGHGLVFNPGERVEGYTNFLWTVLAAGVEALGVGADALMPLASLAAAALLFARLLRRARAAARAAGDASPWAGAPACALLALSPSVAFYAVTGLETLAFAALVFVAVEALIDRRALRFGALTALAFLTRPEAALLGLGGVGWWAAQGLFARADDARAEGRALALRAVAVMAPVVGAYLAWKLWYYGALLPNTFYAKAATPLRGTPEALRWVAPLAALALAPLAAGIKARALSRDERVAVAVTLLGVLAALAEGADWMPVGRFSVHLVPWAALAADRALRASLRASWARRGAVAAALALTAAVWIPGEAVLRPGIAQVEQGTQALRALAYRLHLAGVRRLALMDIGMVGYVLSDVTITDLGALTDRELARTPGPTHGKTPTAAWLRRRAPEVVVLNSYVPYEELAGARGWLLRAQHPVERALLRLPEFRAGYRYACTVRTTYFINVFARADVDPARLVDPRLCERVVRVVAP